MKLATISCLPFTVSAGRSTEHRIAPAMHARPPIDTVRDGPKCCARIPAISAPKGDTPRISIDRMEIARPRIASGDIAWIRVLAAVIA